MSATFHPWAQMMVSTEDTDALKECDNDVNTAWAPGYDTDS